MQATMELSAEQAQVTPEIVAAITGALIASGLLDEGSKITGIRPLAKQNAWKRAGLTELMQGRDFSKTW